MELTILVRLPFLCYLQGWFYDFIKGQPTPPVGGCRQAIVGPRQLRLSQAMSAWIVLRHYQSPSELSMRQQLLKITLVAVCAGGKVNPQYT